MPTGKKLKPGDLHRTIFRYIMPKLRELADPATGLWEGNLNTTVIQLLKDNPATVGNVILHTKLLQALGLVKLHQYHIAGKAAQGRGAKRSTMWAVAMKRYCSTAELESALTGVREDNRERHRRAALQKAKEARLAGEHGEQAEGGPVEVSHFHRHVLDHEHEGRSGPHDHLYPEEEGQGNPYPRFLVPSDGPLGLAKPEPPVRTIRRKVEEGMAGNGRPAVVETLLTTRPPKEGETASEGRHRRLMNLVVELEARVAEAERARAAATERADHFMEEAQAAQARVQELEELLDQATDPTERAAEEFLAARGK